MTIKLARFRGYDKLTENILANPVYGIKADESNEFLRNLKLQYRFWLRETQTWEFEAR